MRTPPFVSSVEERSSGEKEWLEEVGKTNTPSVVPSSPPSASLNLRVASQLK